MRKAMEDKSVCYYCGTIYEKELGKCPLCGSTVQSSQDEAARPQPRRRLTEKERKERRKKSKGKFAKKKNKVSSRPIMIAALVFLILAVLVMGWFIADMIGWLPGFEDKVERDSTLPSAQSTSCEELTVTPEKIELTEEGATAEVEIRVNLYCEDTVYVNSADASVVTVSSQAVTEEADTYKTAVFVLTAVKEGQTEIKVSCGDRTASCAVICDFSTASTQSSENTGDVQPTGDTDTPTQEIPDDYLPELNYDGDLTLTARGEKITLRVTNLPAGEPVTWTSEDESVVKVNAYGEVTAIGGGKTKILVTACGKTTELLVRCNFGDFIDEGAHLESGRSDVTVVVGETFSLYLYDSDGDRIDDITYSVEDPSICEVTDGIVKALSSGTTVVTIDYYGTEYTCIVRVR